MPRLQITQISIQNFKRIVDLNLDISPITALVGGNTSGKSSVLQASQLAISLLQAAYRTKPRGKPYLVGSVSDEEVSFRPTHKIVDLRRGRPATEREGFDISIAGEMEVNGALVQKSVSLKVRRGKNANVSLRREGDDDFAIELASPLSNTSIFTPGLAGISTREELKSRGALASKVMQGDANTYLRSLLHHLFEDTSDWIDDDDPAWKYSNWNESSITDLPECKWKRFCLLLDEVYEGARIQIGHDVDKDQFVDVVVKYHDQTMPLDLASTGMLQVIQILAYSCFFEPPLLLLDEPDAHLHADSQSKLLNALVGLTTRLGTRIILTSHSPQLIQRMNGHDDIQIIWMEDGEKVDLEDNNLPAVPMLMSLGAMGVGADAFNPEKTVILLTEDKNEKLTVLLAGANGAGENLAVVSYNGCENLQGARQLGLLLKDLRPDCSIIIHRDRDFRTDSEMKFENLLFKSWLETQGGEGVFEIFTDLNDVEHRFASIGHLNVVFPELERSDLEKCISEAIADLRDDFVGCLDRARGVINTRIYDTPRLRKRTEEWQAAGMPEKSPKTKTFRPASSHDPWPFEQCHGKMLEKAVRQKVAGLVGGNVDEIVNRMHSVSVGLKDERWFDLINSIGT